MLFSVEMKAHKEHTRRKKSEMRKDGKVRVMGKKLSYIIGFFSSLSYILFADMPMGTFNGKTCCESCCR